MNRKEVINQVAHQVRNNILSKYGSTMGKCIEASDAIVDELKKKGIKSQAIKVYCLYENIEQPEICYEEHWLVKFRCDNEIWYLDVTIDQFQWAFYNQLPQIYCSTKLPRFYLKKITNEVLSVCGWNDWYNTGNYYNGFQYWD